MIYHQKSIDSKFDMEDLDTNSLLSNLDTHSTLSSFIEDEDERFATKNTKAFLIDPKTSDMTMFKIEDLLQSESSTIPFGLSTKGKWRLKNYGHHNLSNSICSLANYQNFTKSDQPLDIGVKTNFHSSESTDQYPIQITALAFNDIKRHDLSDIYDNFPDSKQLAIGDTNGNIWIIDLYKNKWFLLQQLSSPILLLQYHPRSLTDLYTVLLDQTIICVNTGI